MLQEEESVKYRTGTWAANYGLATAGVDDAEVVAIAQVDHRKTRRYDKYNLQLVA